MPDVNDFTDALDAPADTSRSGLTVGLSPSQRLDLAMRRSSDAPPPSPDESKTTWSSGVPNPYGRGVAAFEPNNIIFDAYRNAKGEVDDAAMREAAAAATTTRVVGGAGPGGGAGGAAGSMPTVAADGKVKAMINAAMGLAARRVPYVWGGTSANGVDCSGLIYYAARAAGIQLNGRDWPRLRAVDYGHLGAAVTMDQARAGDIIYYDEPGGTDHVGIYIGNGQMIQAPQSGDVVKVSGIGNRPRSAGSSTTRLRLDRPARRRHSPGLRRQPATTRRSLFQPKPRPSPSTSLRRWAARSPARRAALRRPSHPHLEGDPVPTRSTRRCRPTASSTAGERDPRPQGSSRPRRSTASGPPTG
jgi:cell wall-associated NlpC family hydrolase